MIKMIVIVLAVVILVAAAYQGWIKKNHPLATKLSLTASAMGFACAITPNAA